MPAEGYSAEGDEDRVEVLPIYLVAAPASRVLPGGLIDARADFPAYLENAPDTSKRLEQVHLLSDEPLTVYRCVRDTTWWVMLTPELAPELATT